MLPSDPMMLLSVINMKLRDEFDSLEDCCEYYDLDRNELEKKLEQIGYRYDPQQKRFR